MKRKLVGTDRGSVFVKAVIILAFITVGIIAVTGYFGVKTITELLTENKQLKESLARLTEEDQIGYAKVVKQERKDGGLETTLKFVETARDDKSKRILEKEYTIDGDVVHFDALIVKFSSQLIIDGKERSLYLWRRVYGENMAPNTGYPIEETGQEPIRYKGLLEKLRLKDQRTFWNAIWELSNDPQKLKQVGVQAIYGNAIYSKLRPGIIYVFKISNSGQVYPETVPEM
ncbi:MAG: hypothetical protein WCH75_28150 [Candidatus Binatia bacterium]